MTQGQTWVMKALSSTGSLAVCKLAFKVINSVQSSRIHMPGWRNGRRIGLKIRTLATVVWVRLPPRAGFCDKHGNLTNNKNMTLNFQKLKNQDRYALR